MAAPDIVVDGWCVIENFLPPDEIGSILAECDRLLAMPPEERAVGDKAAAGTQHLQALAERSSLIEEIVSRPTLLEPVVHLLGTDHRRDQISYRNPQPGYGSQKLHADGLPRLGGEPPTVATAIVALTDFTEHNGSTRVVRGSHRRPDLQRLSGNLDQHADETRLTGPAGTVFVFDGNLLHSGTSNESSAARPALQLVWRSRPNLELAEEVGFEPTDP